MILFFLISQLIGLFITTYYKTNPFPFGIEPAQNMGIASVVILFLLLIITTIIILLLIKTKKFELWKLLYLTSLLGSLTISIYPIFKEMAIVLAILAVTIRMRSGDETFHNMTELLLYGGIAALLSPMFSTITAGLLLLIISAYDYFGVIMSKHIVSLVKGEGGTNLFAGLKIDKSILGGGDIAFPLIFASTLPLISGVIVSIFAALGLYTLLRFGKRGKYYPAMPFITIGCLLGAIVSIFLH